MVRHAPIHRRSGHSDIALCCGRNVRGSSLSTSVVPLSNQVTTLNHKRFKGFKMFSDGHSDRNLCSRSKSSCIMMWSATIRGAYMRFDFSFKASRQSFRVVYVKRSSPKRSRNASAAVRDGSRSEQRIASHHVGRDRRGLGCQVHDKNASTPCISPHGERLRYPLSSGAPLRSRFSAGSRSDFQKSWAETSLESFMPGMQSHANQGVGCMSDFCSSCANSLW